MADEPRWEDIFSSQPDAGPSAESSEPDAAPRSRREAREAESRARGSRGKGSPKPPRPPRRPAASGASGASGGSRPPRDPREPRKRRRWIGWLVAVVVVLGLGAGAAGYVWLNYEDQVRKVLGWEIPIDYEGEGTGSVIVTITNGQLGSDVARTLHEAGVTMTSEAFYNLLLTRPDVQFQPGSYELKLKMSASAALEALLDPANKVQTRIGFPEGSTVATVLARLGDLSESTGVSLEELEVAAEDFGSFGLPSDAVSLEGYLFPATYALDPGLSAHEILQTMVDEMFSRLDAAGVAPEDRARVLTIASLIQREAGRNADDFYKVSRVIQNRLDAGMRLQFDSTAHYGYVWKHGARDEGGVFSTSEELADDNPYNTYVHTGLPVGPIGAPGELAIDAALNPAPGDWLYFVTVNLDTGETKFSTTVAEHNAAVQELREWCRTSKSPNCG